MTRFLKTGRKWRNEPGPLKLRRIDVGGGALRIDPKYGGVTVAEVQADLGGHGVTVDSTSADQFVYQSTKHLTVKGSGFDHVKTEEGFGPPKFRWFSGIKGRGQNYTAIEVEDNYVGDDGRGRAGAGPEGVEGLGAPFPFPPSPS